MTYKGNLYMWTFIHYPV